MLSGQHQLRHEEGGGHTQEHLTHHVRWTGASPQEELSSAVHSSQDDSGEEEDSSGSDDDMEEEEAEGVRRYSLRDRSRVLVQRYSPRAGASGAFSVGLKRRRSIVEQVARHARVAGLDIIQCRPCGEEAKACCGRAQD